MSLDTENFPPAEIPATRYPPVSDGMYGHAVTSLTPRRDSSHGVELATRNGFGGRKDRHVKELFLQGRCALGQPQARHRGRGSDPADDQISQRRPSSAVSLAVDPGAPSAGRGVDLLRGHIARGGGGRHLGLLFRASGQVALSRDKCRKIENLFRFAFRRTGKTEPEALQGTGGPHQDRAAAFNRVARLWKSSGAASPNTT